MNWMAPIAASGVLLVSAVSAVAQTHELKLSPENVHWGDFDASVKPVLRIASGETVRVRRQRCLVHANTDEKEQAGDYVERHRSHRS